MKSQIYTALAIQYLTGCIFLLGLSAWNASSVFSGFAGCLAALLPATYIGSRMVKSTQGYSARQWLAFAYRAQLGKWFMTIMIFALILMAQYSWQYVILFSGYCLIQVAGGVVPLIIKGD